MAGPLLNPLHMREYTGSDPSVVDGDVWVRSDNKEIRMRTGGVTYIVGADLHPIPFSFGGLLFVRSGTIRAVVPWACEWAYTEVFVNTVPTGAAVIVDINRATAGAPGTLTTIHTTQTRRPTVAVSTNRATITAAPDVTAYSAGDSFTMDVDQIGSTIAGSDLGATLWVRRTG